MQIFLCVLGEVSAISAVKSFYPDSMTTQPTLAKDPVCGMTVDPAKAKATAEHAGQNYYFCCAGCAQKFQSNPEQYLKPKPALVTIGNAPLNREVRSHAQRERQQFRD